MTMLKRLIRFTTLATVMLAALAGPQAAHAIGPVCRVWPAAPGPTHDGSSWSNAYTDLQAALAEAGCTELWVASGVYKPGTLVTDSFVISPGVQLYGGFAATESARAQRNYKANVTILSGDIDGNDLDADGNHIDEVYTDIVGTNSYHVVYLNGMGTTPVTGTTVLDGFTITGGQATGSYAAAEGGGLRCDGDGGSPTHACSPTLTNLTFSGNMADRGGAVYNNGVAGTSEPIFTNVTFTGNHAGSVGGAVYNDGTSSGHSGSGFSNVTFMNNSALDGGGALYNDGGSGGSSSPALMHVIFSNNTSGYGGAVHNRGVSSGVSNPVLIDVTFSGNSASNSGGGMYDDGAGGTSSPALINVTFSANSTTGGGGALVNDGTYSGLSSPVLQNVTFSGNSAQNGGGAIANYGYLSGVSQPTLTNVILWGDLGPPYREIYNNSAAPTISYSVVQGGCASIAGATCGSGNLDTDPGLAPLANNGGFSPTQRLLPGGSAIDTGTSAGCPSTDQRSVIRPMDGNYDGAAVCDIGAFEATMFADVPVAGKEWMEPWIDAFYQHGVTNGCGLGPLVYCPENNVTRAEMAVFLLRAKHGSGYTPPPATHTFTDVPVPGKEWMEPWIDEFYAEGITSGCGVSPLRYCPEQNVTRAEMAVFVLRATHTTGWAPPAASGIFSDVPVAGKEWMQPWIIEYYNEGITSGCGIAPLRYCPENNTTRAEMAVFIGRAYGLYP
jgi:predicted outer membrane repeat protein